MQCKAKKEKESGNDMKKKMLLLRDRLYCICKQEHT